MQKRLFNGWILSGFALCFALLAGCSSIIPGSAASPTPSATSGCSGQSVDTGTVQNKGGSSFTLATQSHGTLQIDYTSTTLAVQQKSATVSNIQKGNPVRVAVTKGSNNAYTATIIVVMGPLPAAPGTGSNGNGGIGGLGGSSGSVPSGGPGEPGGNPGAPGTPGGQNGGNGPSAPGGSAACNIAPQDPTSGHLTISGMAGTVSDSQIIVLDASNQPAATIAITGNTQIIKMDAVTFDALQNGMKVSVTSTSGSGSKRVALALTILL